MVDKETIKQQFEDIINKFKKYDEEGKLLDSTEETVRDWVNEMLTIFGWDIKKTDEVKQEKKLSDVEEERLKLIESTHTKPDYTFMHGKNIKTFLDTKDLTVKVEQDKSGTFQIKSYGWSARVPCAIITNFKEMAIYDCRFVPNKNDDTNKGRIYFTIDEYLDNFDVIFDRLYKDNVINGNLEILYNKIQTEGTHSVDDLFTLKLSNFRRELAQHILDRNPTFINNDDTKLNYFTQIILDRIMFVRVCESRSVEKVGLLKEFESQGFWDKFKSSCFMEFYEHYDGPMFDGNPELKKIQLENSFFNVFIDELYYPSPYKFDVIPVEVLADIYEKFLVKQLIINDSRVDEIYKIDYVKTQGAISTPKYIVDTICKDTVDLSQINCIEEILKLRILEPACGSGTFLISIFELLEKKIMELKKTNKTSSKYSNWFVICGGDIYLTIEAKKEIISKCIYGIDLDFEAVEVAKMSLALKVIDNNNLLTLEHIGAFGEKILSGIGSNVIVGNSLVKPDIYIEEDLILSHEDKKIIKPTDIENGRFSQVFINNGGFDYIVGNPPYVETKHYKAYMPIMHSYISRKYLSYHGKADLSIIFIERCLQLLNSKGRLGFIVQKRFFKTEYGKEIRKILSSQKLLDIVIDFETDTLFKDRTTYVAVLILDKINKNQFTYVHVDGEALQVENMFENKKSHEELVQVSRFGSEYITEKPWNFNNMEVLTIVSELRERIGTLNSYPGLSIKDGIQVLWKDIYHIKNWKINEEFIQGKNGFDEDVEVELDACKPVIYNKVFYCFKDLSPDAYAIFPYEGVKLNNKIKFSDFCKRYPKAGKYLKDNRERILANVRTIDEEEYWHTFTREHNHKTFNENKIIIPMTAKDTIATVVFNNGLYMDNSNVWFITVQDGDEKLLRAITAIINSKAFSVFARSEANPQRGGYYKFNKQFLNPVPFPVEALKGNTEIVQELSDLSVKICDTQKEFMTALEHDRDNIGAELEVYWCRIDDIVMNLYGLTVVQKKIVSSYGRNESRLFLLK